MKNLTLFFDLETTGLWRDHLDLADPSQPHIVQIAARLVDGANRRAVGDFCAVIKPDGWGIEPGAEQVHGISEETAYACGVPMDAALRMLMGFVIKAGEIVAHNIQFDRTMIDRELLHLNATGKWWTSRAKDMRCTMELSTPVLNLPGKFPGKPKYPTLDEAYTGLIGGSVPGHHNARTDAAKCEAIWWAIKDRQNVPA